MRLLAISVLFLTACSVVHTPVSKPLPPQTQAITGDSSQLIVVVRDDWEPAKQPLYLLLPKQQFQQLRQAWQLPALPPVL